MDNGSRHAGKTSVKRMSDADPNAKLIHLPVHASWLNQIEIYCSIVQRKALTPNDFATLPELAQHLIDFGHHYRTLARPFQWTFTHAKLDAVIEKITRHQPQPLALAARAASLLDTSTRRASRSETPISPSVAWPESPQIRARLRLPAPFAPLLGCRQSGHYALASPFVDHGRGGSSASPGSRLSPRPEPADDRFVGDGDARADCSPRVSAGGMGEAGSEPASVPVS